MNNLVQNNHGSQYIIKTMLESNIVATYVGLFDGEILSVLAENIKFSLKLTQSQGRKFFKIFIELAQNISLHSAVRTINKKNKSFGEGSLIIHEFEKYFIISTGNIIENKDVKELSEKCKLINTLDRDGLRQLKIKLRGQKNDLGGGNIGLVHVALIAKQKIEFKFTEIEDNKSFYVVRVRIYK